MTGEEESALNRFCLRVKDEVTEIEKLWPGREIRSGTEILCSVI